MSKLGSKADMAQFDLSIYKDFVRNNPYEVSQNNVTDTPAKVQVQVTADAKTKVAEPQTKVEAKIPNSNFTELKDEFIKAQKNRGLFERFYDFCKNITSFGSGSNKLAAQISLAEAGKLSEKDLKDNIEKYKYSNHNARKTFGDTLSSLAAIGTFFGLSNYISTLNAMFEVGAEDGSLLVRTLKASDEARKMIKNVKGHQVENLKKLVGSSVKSKLKIVIPAAMIVGGFVKYFALKINRIGSKEFETGDKKVLGKEKYKAAKKEMKKKKRADSFKNLWTGMINGLLTPITMISGGIIGVPLYVLSTFGIRYSTSDTKNKSFSDFGKKLGENGVFNGIMALIAAIPLFKTARYSHVLNKNLNEAVSKLKNVKLEASELVQTGGAYAELEKRLMNTPTVKAIMDNHGMPIEEKISKLTEENLFVVKFKQISGKNDALTFALKEKCPPTRTIEEAGEEICKLLGNPNYKVTKRLGVGTVAETYLATDPTGKEVAVKIIKRGITKEKILADKEKFLQLVTNGAADSELTQKQIYLKKNIENLAESILKEIDLQNEAKSALELAKTTKLANVVVPVLAKDGIYVMEKANGISVGALHEYVMAKSNLTFYQNLIKKEGNSELWAKSVAEAERKIEQIKKTSPAFEDFDITPNQVKKVLKEYMDIYMEQFVKLHKNGKVIHGDIHPGNIFIDLDVLKGTRKGKLFTLIDTGNTINLTKEQTKDALRLIPFIKNGNYKDIARIVTETSILPEGMTRENAREFVEAELKKYFTDTSHSLEKMTADTLFDLTDAIQGIKGIIPNNTQLTLVKSKKSAATSFKNLRNSFLELKFGNVDDDSKVEIAKAIATLTKDMTDITTKALTANRIQETKNLFQMSPKEALLFLRNKNMLPTNSLEHIIYKLKQDIPKAEQTLGQIKIDL